MKQWKQVLIVMMLAMGIGAAALPAGSASAINVFDDCSGQGSTAVCQAAGTDEATSMVEIIINTMLFLIGAISVVMIVYGGIRYTTSAGDASRVKSAKDTIVYSVVGLVVALLAYAIVFFVLDQF